MKAVPSWFLAGRTKGVRSAHRLSGVVTACGPFPHTGRDWFRLRPRVKPVTPASPGFLQMSIALPGIVRYAITYEMGPGTGAPSGACRHKDVSKQHGGTGGEDVKPCIVSMLNW